MFNCLRKGTAQHKKSPCRKKLYLRKFGIFGKTQGCTVFAPSRDNDGHVQQLRPAPKNPFFAVVFLWGGGLFLILVTSTSGGRRDINGSCSSSHALQRRRPGREKSVDDGSVKTTMYGVAAKRCASKCLPPPHKHYGVVVRDKKKHLYLDKGSCCHGYPLRAIFQPRPVSADLVLNVTPR